MVIDWVGVFKTVGTAGVIAVAGAFLLRKVVRQLLSRDLQDFTSYRGYS